MTDASARDRARALEAIEFYDHDQDETCPNCGGEGLVWGCFEDTCVCVDDDGLGCAPTRCDWCKPMRKSTAPEREGK